MSRRLVPSAIHRKLDPALPGIDESVAEIETITLPRFQIGYPPQRLVMTILGEFWVGRTEPIPSGALVRLLGAFEINEPAARVALARLAARGVLSVERRGRTTAYQPSPHLLTVLPQGRAVTERFGAPRSGWDGTWTVLAWNVTNQSSAFAHRIRTDLRELGFASLTNGIWVSPDPPTDQLHHTLTRSGDLHYSLLTGATEVASSGFAPGDAWDFAEIHAEYVDFVEHFGLLLERAGTNGLTGEEAFAALVKAVYRWFVIATLDPDLPAELLPANWPRTSAHELFVALVNTVAPAAEAFARDVIGAFHPELAELVTGPRPY